MEEEKDPSPKFINGFNAGYELSKHEPELLNQILKSENNQNYFIHAMKFGHKQHQKEELINQQRDIVKRKPNISRKKYGL